MSSRRRARRRGALARLSGLSRRRSERSNRCTAAENRTPRGPVPAARPSTKPSREPGRAPAADRELRLENRETEGSRTRRAPGGKAGRAWEFRGGERLQSFSRSRSSVQEIIGARRPRSASWAFESQTSSDPIVVLQRGDAGGSLLARANPFHGGRGGGERRQAGDRQTERSRPDRRLIVVRRSSERRVDDQLNLARLHSVYRVRVALVDFEDSLRGEARLGKRLRRTLGGAESEFQVDELARNGYQVLLVIRIDREKRPPRSRQAIADRLARLGKRVSEPRRGGHHLAGRFHLRPQQRVLARKLLEGKDRRLDEEVGRVSFRRQAERRERFSCGEQRRVPRHRDADRLGDERDSPRGARVDLQDMEHASLAGELDVHEPAHTKGLREPSR